MQSRHPTAGGAPYPDIVAERANQIRAQRDQISLV